MSQLQFQVPPRVTAVHGVNESMKSVKMTRHMSDRGCHELRQGAMATGDDGGRVMREPEGVVCSRRGQVSQNLQVFLISKRSNNKL